jgi:hypothetical protein
LTTAARPTQVHRAVALVARDAAAMTVEDVIAAVGASADDLTDTEVESRAQAVGRNVPPVHRARPGEILGRQLRSPLLVLLLVAAVLSTFVGERADTVIIGLITGASVGLRRARRHAADRLHRPRVRRIGAHRRVVARHQGFVTLPRGRDPRQAVFVCAHRHDRPRRQRRGDRGRHLDEHRVRTDRRDVPTVTFGPGGGVATEAGSST